MRANQRGQIFAVDQFHHEGPNSGLFNTVAPHVADPAERRRRDPFGDLKVPDYDRLLYAVVAADLQRPPAIKSDSRSLTEAGSGGHTHFFTVAIQMLPWRSVIANTSPVEDMSRRCGLSAVVTIC